MSPAARVLIAVALANALVPLNTTMIVIALPEIARDSGSDVATASWLITIYLITLTALQPIGGRLGDRFGRRRLLLASFAYLAVASLGAALSSGVVLLAFFRLHQAVAGAILVPNGLGILRRIGGRRAGTQFGIITTVAGVGATVGPIVGTVLKEIDWHLLFFVNLPIAALAFWLVTVRLPADTEERGAHPSFDLAGAAALGTLLFAVAWVLTGLGRTPPDAATGLLVAGVVVGVALFVRYERSIADPMLPPVLFRFRAFTASNLSILFANLALYTSLVAVPALLVEAAAPALVVGVALTAINIPGIALGPATGWVVDRWGARWPTTLGGVLIALGAAGVGLALAGGRHDLVAAAMFVLGAGVPLTFPATRIAAVDAVPARYTALASGVLATSRSLGGMLGVTMVAVALTALPSTTRAASLFAVVTASGVLVAIASLGMPDAPHVPEAAPAEAL